MPLRAFLSQSSGGFGSFGPPRLISSSQQLLELQEKVYQQEPASAAKSL